ncbi:MAG TPA: hypothetical protein VFJ94_02550, partial [Intrasporangium sp.]|uniref:hypothetical protein n=1 Tax=Intrasporangium sp. TaxID=1925024 RepID=UPI002D7967FE
GPWWLVDEWAQVTNVLCPWDSELMTPWLSTVSGGPQWLGGDVYAGRSLLVTDPAVTCYAVDSTGAYVKVPVLPSAPLVASAWVNTTGMKVGLAFYTAAGGFLSVIESASTVTGWSRVATLGTAPATAGYAIPYVKGAAGRLARPCVTWTDALMEHSTGHGGIVVVDGYGLDVTSAHTAYRGRMAQAAVSFVEVGL